MRVEDAALGIEADVQVTIQQRTYTFTSGGKVFTVPHPVGKALALARVIYMCSGCPEWHVYPAALPEGVTQAAFNDLCALMFPWQAM